MHWSLVALLLLVLPVTTAAQTDRRPIALGEARIVRSNILSENRELQIALPANYAYTGIRYPVLYILDGSSNFLHATATARFLAAARNRVPEMIVVAVPNTNRNRDLSPGPGAATFQRVLSEELIPWVEKNYRAAPERVVLGHSRGGMFVVHTLLHRAELFNGYIVVSAPLYRYDSLATQARAGLPRASGQGRTLYLAVGDEETADMRRGMEGFATLLRALGGPPSTLEWKFETLADEHHNSSINRGLYEGLEARYRAYRFPFFETIAELDSLGGLRAVEAHYRGFASRFGYPTMPPEGRLAQAARLLAGAQRYEEVMALSGTYLAAYPALAQGAVDLVAQDQLQRGRAEDAVRTLAINVERFASSPNAHRALGEGYCRTGQNALAVQSFEAALRVARATATERVPAFEARARRGCNPPASDFSDGWPAALRARRDVAR